MNRQDHELAAHDPWLRRLARRLARSRTRADDLVQDTYVTALRNAPPDAQLRPWLHSVMRKLAWGQVRSEQRRVQREEGFSLTAPMLTLPDVLPDHGVDRERLNAALARLPEPFHSTIVQRFLEGCSCAEIARRDNIPAGTVRWRQSRGLELLRAELEPPRKRFAIWALPFLGAGEQLVARLWQGVVARVTGSKALWLLLACAAVLYAIAGGTPPPGSVAGSLADRRDDIALAARARAGSARLAAALELHAPRSGPGGSEPAAPSDLGVTDVTHRTMPTGRALGRAARSDALDIHRDDCTWDPVHGRRCTGAPGTPAAEAACALIRAQLRIADALALGSPTGRAMLAQALQAKLALAARLGCRVEPADHGRPPGAGRKPADDRDDQPPAEDTAPPPPAPPPRPDECWTATNIDGYACTVCQGQAPVCKVPGCTLRTTASGGECTVCTDGVRETSTDCPAAQVASCHSEIVSGMLCTSCDGQPGPPECLPAECWLAEYGCLRCVDPKDRLAQDCSMDFGVYGSTPFGRAGPALTSCDMLSGIPNVSGMTCHYPGTGSCTTLESDRLRCLECTFRESAASGLCVDADGALPDPFDGRPSDLPPPNHCVTELAIDGTVACATCTRGDLSATRSCR